MREILETIDDRGVWKIVCQKPAQVAWTDGVINNSIGKRIHLQPGPMIVMFPKDGAAKEYVAEKFEPMVECTPVLAERVDISRKRRTENRQLFKSFAGGFLKLVGSNSPSSVKSTPAPFVVIEEPDDCNLNLKGQGDSIKLLEERTKTYARRKVLAGGTPSIKGLSSIEAEMLISDQRRYMVPCHHCGESHELAWDNVHWLTDRPTAHPVYGRARPETAVYACPHCGGTWNDQEKNRNVRSGQWVATAPFSGVAGFYLNELVSPFPGSVLRHLVERYLVAQHELEQGQPGSMITFVNSALGMPYEYQSDSPAADALEERAEPYDERTVPLGGLLLTMGVDVQHDRLAVVIRAWGREEESWLVWWGELVGTPADKTDPVWTALDDLVYGVYSSAGGFGLRIAAVSIDASDGQTNDAVYHYVRSRRGRGVTVMAIKGASRDSMDKEIFSKPRESVDTNYRNTKASRYGLRVYIVGTHKAKDLIDGRHRLTGSGAGRVHWYKAVRADYWEQVTSEVYAPHPRNPKRKVWQVKAGARNEALDCEVYALHAARGCKVHLLKESDWTEIERQLRQVDLFAPAPEAAPAAQQQSTAASSGGQSSDWLAGVPTDNW